MGNRLLKLRLLFQLPNALPKPGLMSPGLTPPDWSGPPRHQTVDVDVPDGVVRMMLRDHGRIIGAVLVDAGEQATADLRAQLEDAQQRANEEIGNLNRALTELETERDALRERLERHVQAVRDIAGVDESRMTAGAVAPGAGK